MIVVASPLLLYASGRMIRQELSGARPEPTHPPAWLPWTIAVIISVFWIVRNIPVYPFTLLAPH